MGLSLLQESKPVAFASRALTSAERNCAQIEKLLAVVFAADKFEQHIYGSTATVKNDHRPLEVIWKKPMQTPPQRMLLRLQKYDLNSWVQERRARVHCGHAQQSILKPEQVGPKAATQTEPNGRTTPRIMRKFATTSQRWILQRICRWQATV